MKIKYFQNTDTLYIEFHPGRIAETRDLDENTLPEVGEQGRVCALTMEHASQRTSILAFSHQTSAFSLAAEA